MEDLMNKLQNVLNDEESMKQISELASMLAGEMGNSQPENPPVPKSSPTNEGSPDFGELLKGLSGMFGSNSANQTNQNQSAQPVNNPLPDFDMSKFLKLQSILQSAGKPDKNVALILALKPLLREETQQKADRVIKIFKLFAIYPALKESGLLGGDFFGIL